MKYPIDLGKCLGCGNTDAWPYMSGSPSDKIYPTVFIEGLEDLPTDGIITLKFHVKEEVCRTVDGKETCSTCLEVQEILDVKGDWKVGTAEVETENPGDRLDAMLSEVEDAD